MEAWKEELYHHGILGMKWGKRNGPPYPLGSGDHSASEKKAGWRKSLKSNTDKTNSNKSRTNSRPPSFSKKKGFKLTENQKKALKIGAAVAATALVAYGGYKIGSSYFTRSLAQKSLVGDVGVLPNDNLFDNVKKLSPNEIPKDVTDLFGNLDGNPLRKADDVQNNCTNVFLAAIGRLRGLNVSPGFQKDASGAFKGLFADDVITCFKGGSGTDSLGNSILKRSLNGKGFESYENAVATIKRRCGSSDGTTGYLDMWIQLRPNGKATHHAVTWTIKNGVVNFGDGVNGLKANKYFKFIVPGKEVSFFRCDNLELDMSEYLKYVILN